MHHIQRRSVPNAAPSPHVALEPLAESEHEQEQEQEQAEQGRKECDNTKAVTVPPTTGATATATANANAATTATATAPATSTTTVEPSRPRLLLRRRISSLMRQATAASHSAVASASRGQQRSRSLLDRSRQAVGSSDRDDDNVSEWDAKWGITGFLRVEVTDSGPGVSQVRSSVLKYDASTAIILFNLK
jgi:hypothetical protein